jgi:hypothetical protein
MTLANQIKHFLEKEAPHIYDIQLIRKAEIENGIAYEFQHHNYKFGCVLQEFQALKISFYLYDHFQDDAEKEFWTPRYKFKLFTEPGNKDYKIALNIFEIKDFLTNMPIRIIMYRYIKTLFQYKRDFKALIYMAKSRENKK